MTAKRLWAGGRPQAHVWPCRVKPCWLRREFTTLYLYIENLKDRGGRWWLNGCVRAPHQTNDHPSLSSHYDNLTCRVSNVLGFQNVCFTASCHNAQFFFASSLPAGEFKHKTKCQLFLLRSWQCRSRGWALKVQCVQQHLASALI